jgi:hypothetical protein
MLGWPARPPQHISSCLFFWFFVFCLDFFKKNKICDGGTHFERKKKVKIVEL